MVLFFNGVDGAELYHGAVRKYHQREAPAAGNADGIAVGGNVALAIGVGAAGDEGPVRLKAYGMVCARVYGYYIRPRGNVALAVGIEAGGDTGAVLKEGHHVAASNGDLLDIRPAGDAAFAVGVLTRGDDGAVGLETHGKGYARADIHYIRPPGDMAHLARRRRPCRRT